MTNYAVIYECADDGSWSARAADLPVHSAGATRADVEGSIREAIVLYLDHLRSTGQEVPAPRVEVGTVAA
jgi:predicted RNase H-like HicB family nuclease